MSTEENKKTARRVYDELINGEDLAVMGEIFAPDVTIHDPLQGTLQGPEALAQLIEVFNRAFPGHRAQVDAVLAEGDYVAVLHTHYGRHTGPFLHLPPTGREFAVGGIELMRVVDGRIVEFWRKDDDLDLLIQLGAVPALT